ncbi:MAG: AAA family ATPase [Candidatus Harrisonbacteria bacterium]|nr:AAA family ATPase [Candidatus Harrisonbacteria bacterium]
MYLKHLELIGFKSFAPKTILDFPAGIIGIVGPNGSGKSNIIDAVRWILGEREAKNLRGGKAEDLIFAGTPKRPRMGMAQVTLTFDNASGFFPVDYKEVSIQRRIERDGNSHYFLNKAEVRLRDIIDFFAKVRLGTRGLSIINQGSSDLFVRAAPEERRAMIEEILGLRQYQLKKHEADRKLKNTRINIEKVRAMIEEVAPHLRFLKRQTAKWGKLSDLEKEIKDLENIYFAHKLKEIREGVERLDPQIKKLDSEIGGKQNQLRVLKMVVEKIEAGKPGKNSGGELRKKREVLLQERSEIEREVGKLEAKIEFLNSVAASENLDLRSGELLTVLEEVKDSLEKLMQEKNLEKVHSDLRALLEKVAGVTDRSSKKKNEIADLKSVKDALLKKLVPIRDELSALTSKEEASAKEFEEFNDQFRGAFEKMEIKKEEISGLDKEKNKLLFDLERFNLRKQDLEMQINQIGRKLDEFISPISPIGLIDDLPALERKMLRLRSEIAGIGEVDQALIKEAEETETRHNFLAGQLADLEKAATDLEQLIQELEEKIDNEFQQSFRKINTEFDKFFNLMFGGGKAKLVLEKPEPKVQAAVEGVTDPEMKEHRKETEDLETEELKQTGIEIDLSLPRKRIHGLDMLSGGEKSLVSIAALFALISVSPPPFLVLDEVDAALDEKNTKRFADIVRDFSKKTQFLIVTHNRATMEAANILYGVTMEEDGVSKVLSLKLE